MAFRWQPDVAQPQFTTATYSSSCVKLGIIYSVATYVAVYTKSCVAVAMCIVYVRM